MGEFVCSPEKLWPQKYHNFDTTGIGVDSRGHDYTLGNVLCLCKNKRVTCQSQSCRREMYVQI